MTIVSNNIIDRDEMAFTRVFAGTGAVPRAEFHAMEWGELLENRNNLNTAINAKLEESDENGSPTAEIAQAISYAGLVLDTLQSEINFRDSNGNRNPRASSRRSQPDIPGRRPGHAAPLAMRGAAKPGTYQALFGAQGLGGSDFQDLGEFARAVYSQDPKLFQNAPAGMSVGVGPDGGYYVPPGFLAGLLDASLQEEAIRPRATVIPMPSGTTTLPVFNTTDRSAGVAGLEPALVGEGVTGDNQKAKTSTITLTAHKLMVLVPTTAELIEDGGPTFTTLLQKYMVESLGQKLDSLFLNSPAPATPLGIIGAPCTVSVAKETSQVAATVVPANLAKMIARLAPGSFKRAVWLAHPSVLASLFVMATVVKNVAGSENVGGFGPNWFTVNADGTMALLGRPLIVSDRCAPLGTVGDIILADLSQYLIGIRGDARLAVDNSVGFKSDEIYFRLTLRVDGCPLLATAITPRKGADTLSPFVILATRS